MTRIEAAPQGGSKAVAARVAKRACAFAERRLHFSGA
jgi:hypothetical protein